MGLQKDFLYESEEFSTPNGQFCAMMRVLMVVHAENNSSGFFTILSIYDEDNRCFRPWNAFTEKEQDKIWKLADKLADVYNYEAYEQERYPHLYK